MNGRLGLCRCRKGTGVGRRFSRHGGGCCGGMRIGGGSNNTAASTISYNTAASEYTRQNWLCLPSNDLKFDHWSFVSSADLSSVARH